MGKIKQGILGGFSGKVGSVVGSSWKGISYMRGKALSIKNPKTLQQKMQRSKFALTLSVLKPMTAFLRVGFKLYAKNQSGFNAAMSYTIQNAISGAYPNYTLDFDKLLVSRGSLTGAIFPTTDVASGKIEIFWDDNSGIGNAQTTDKAMIVAINPAKEESVFITEGSPRTSGNAEIAVSPYWVGDEVEVYLSFISEDKKSIATSTYCGSVVII